MPKKPNDYEKTNIKLNTRLTETDANLLNQMLKELDLPKCSIYIRELILNDLKRYKIAKSKEIKMNFK